MILGIGTDIVDARRIAAVIRRFPNRFISRIFTDLEKKAAEHSSNKAEYFAKRFAAKEAAYKALSSANVSGLGWREVETLSKFNGVPTINFKGRWKIALESMVPSGYKASVSISLSDEPPYALAFVIVNAIPVDWINENE